MADTPIARNFAARWNDARRNERSAGQAPIVVIKGGVEGEAPARRPRGEARDEVSIHQLPVPVLQLNAARLKALFALSKARGNAEDLLAKAMWHGGLPQAGLFVADANELAASLLQASSSDDLTGPAGYLFAASPQTVARLMRAWFDGEKNFSEPMTMRSVKGALLDVKLSVTFPPADSLEPLLVVLQDMTGQRQPDEHEVDPLHAARLSTLGRLATSIAHEVNQPLAAIVTDCETTMLHLSRDEPNLAKLRELAARMAASAHRASEIVKRVRGMASQSNTRVALDLNDIVVDGLSFVRNETDTHAICVSVACEPGLPAFLGDRIQMQQVVVNLLVNAIEAAVCSAKRPRRIEIATCLTGQRIQFSIHDSGDGIPTADLGRIFDRFYTTKPDGVGVGLSICRSIIHDHGGDMNATNADDGGALFRFSLLVAETERDR
ncbi:signal transduction histidine kinase [Rhizobium sp. BK529]|uniref:sensor histidine kinase n=1 Tax=unclassified Rhizobium TaxID=2613769 RepID=UPI00104C3561|nr:MULTISPECIES: ATP-binding protein [unclassified Rhizobium]MBB3590854.1 signal transduction histidine kinase [Rhizobium sp. BK529]TCS09191.1 phospho-acceptor domain-containing protein [Rhizobium sp. BK418]